MNAQQKLLTVFKLIRELNSPPAKDAKQLMRRLGIKKSTFYEYKKLLEDLGYPIKKEEQNRFYLDFNFSEKEAGILSSDELSFLQDTLQQIGNKSPLAENILHKFNRNLSMIPLADALPQLHASRIIQLTRTGINSKLRLTLRRYRSLSRNTVEDRYVEPLEITMDLRYLIAWDLNRNGQRQFKLNRIEDIDILDEPASLNKLPSPMDIFGLTGDGWLPVTLRLSDMAHHLLLEEFPLSRSYVRKVNHQHIFAGQVRHWKGIGRFVLGLPGEVVVIEPDGFKAYLEERLGGFGELRGR